MHSFQRVIFRKKRSDDSVKKIIYNFINFISILPQETINMNNIKVKVYKKVLQNFFEKNEGAKDFSNKKSAEICSHEKLSTEEIIYFLVGFLQVMLPY